MTYKEAFIRFMAESGVCTRDFTLKADGNPRILSMRAHNKGDELTKLGIYDCLIDNQVNSTLYSDPLIKEFLFR